MKNTFKRYFLGRILEDTNTKLCEERERDAMYLSEKIQITSSNIVKQTKAN